MLRIRLIETRFPPPSVTKVRPRFAPVYFNRNSRRERGTSVEKVYTRARVRRKRLIRYNIPDEASNNWSGSKSLFLFSLFLFNGRSEGNGEGWKAERDEFFFFLLPAGNGFRRGTPCISRTQGFRGFKEQHYFVPSTGNNVCARINEPFQPSFSCTRMCI